MNAQTNCTTSLTPARAPRTSGRRTSIRAAALRWLRRVDRTLVRWYGRVGEFGSYR
jgi:hypothetical protein